MIHHRLRGLLKGGVSYYRVRSTSPGSNNQGVACSELALKVDGEVYGLADADITNLGDAFNEASGYGIDKLNDGILETTNATNVSYLPTGAFDLSIYVPDEVLATHILWAPQGAVTGNIIYNTPLNLTIYTSSDGSGWTEINSFSSISTGYPNWTAGTYREFATGL